MHDADPCPRPYRLTVELEHDPATGAWSYRSEIDTPTGAHAVLSDRTWHRWRDRWRLAAGALRADVAVVEAWAGGALEAMPRG